MEKVGLALIIAGMLLVVVGFVLLAAGKKAETRFAVGGFIGPVPFGFASDKEMLYIAIALTLFIAVFFFLSNLS